MKEVNYMRVIPDNLKKAYKSEKSGNIILPAARMMYASLYTATRPSKSETNPKRFQYSISLLLPAGADLSVLESECQGLFTGNVVEAKRASTKWRKPILKTAEDGSLALYADEYPTLLRMNAKQFQKDGKERPKPDVVAATGHPVPQDREAEETYNGRWCRVSINPYWYPANDGIAGVSLGLVNVQLLWNDDPLAGGKAKASSDFEPVEGLDEMAEDFA